MTVAWVFPGQGSQKLGMAKNVINLENAKNRFNYASELFGKNLFQILEELSEKNNLDEDLNNTKNTQICLFWLESLIRFFKRNTKPNYVAGHSLGEITALYCAGVLSFEDFVLLIKERSKLMAAAEKDLWQH